MVSKAAITERGYPIESELDWSNYNFNYRRLAY